MSISQIQLEQLQGMIASGDPDGFYDWPDWHRIRDAVLAQDHWECQKCKELRRYRKAKIVHHVKHLRDRPDLALSAIDPDTGARQLISLCRACHEAQHPERGMLRHFIPQPQLNEERWD